MSGQAVDGVLRYESSRIRFNEAAIAAMVCATPGGIAGFIIGPPWMFVVFAVTVAAGAWAVRRALRLSLEASPEGVVVRNFWRVYTFAWTDVVNVGLGMEAMGVLPQPAVAFGLRGGKTVRAQATPVKVPEQQAVFDTLAALAPDSVEFFVTVHPRTSDRASVEQP